MHTLSPFHETPYGYEAISRDGQHTYVVIHNGIDYTLTHYWSQNPNGENISSSTSTPSTDARNHYAQLVNPEAK